jgi:hypothetical protein
MPTYVYTKDAFIKYLQDNISENECLVFSNELTGNLSISQRSGLKISHVFAAETFKDRGVGHIYNGDSNPLCMIIADKKRLSLAAANVLNQGEGPKTCDATTAQSTNQPPTK